MQLSAIRAAARAAVEQNRLDPSAYEEFVLRMEGGIQRSPPEPEERAIRQTIAYLIGRVQRPLEVEAGGRAGPLPL